MKKIHRYLIYSFISPFLMTFFISVFILMIRWLYVYIDDLIGKGLSMATLSELFFYVALNTFPLALPLALLLSSLMTFGNLGEHFELVALKSSGLSLQKIMMPLTFVSILLSGGAFLFSNNILPYVNLKMQSLVYDIQQKKPALNIKEGIFYNGIDGYTIRIDKKEKDGVNCKKILLYDHTDDAGNNKVLVADSGKLELSANHQFLNITLFHGTSYEEIVDRQHPNQHALNRSLFKEQDVQFDLSGFKMMRSGEEYFKSSYAMLNLSQINSTIDTTLLEKEERTHLYKKAFSDLFFAQQDSSAKKMSTHAKTDERMIVDAALNLSRSKKYAIESFVSELDNYNRPIISLKVEWHKKFTLSIACLILFFVGAPLGAIIRKGGLGMPVVVSVIIFILFWVMTITGEKMCKEEVITPFTGMWFASIVTLPIGIFLTIKATTDSSILDVDSYKKPFRRLLGSPKKR
jgi:lipopolysaccharide export system permease protein